MIGGIDSYLPSRNPSTPSLLFIHGHVNNKPMEIMLDTGASFSFLNVEQLKHTEHFRYSTTCRQRFYMADGMTSFSVTGIVELNIQLDNVKTTIPAFVAKHLCTDLILGMDYLSKYDLEIRTKSRSILFNVDDRQVIIPVNTKTPSNIYPTDRRHRTTTPPGSQRQIPVHGGLRPDVSNVRQSSHLSEQVSTSPPDSSMDDLDLSASLIFTNSSPHPQCSSRDRILGFGSKRSIQPSDERSDDRATANMPPEPIYPQLNTVNPSPLNAVRERILHLLSHITERTSHDQLKTLLFRFETTFDTSKYRMATTKIAHAIETHPHTPPVSRCYPTTPALINEMRSIIGKLLDARLVRQSQSSYAAPALLTRKKDQTWRLVIDYKKLNALTIRDHHPLPNMEVTLQTLGAGYSFFTKLDLKSGFWQLPIDEKDRFKTAFITPLGLYEWNVLPQGLCNAPPSFQRVMCDVLSRCTGFSLVYLDDIVIYSRTYAEHLYHLEQVLNALHLHRLTLNLEKCEIAKSSIEYLGHILTSSRITPLPSKISAILSLPEPRSLCQANKFIGALSWYRKFIPDFSTIAAPIHAVTNLPKSRRTKFRWADEQSKSFHELKRVLTSTPLFLDFPDDKYPVLLSTDASKVGLGGVLYQEIDGVRKILFYHSEAISPVQQRYHPIELEALAIFKCVNRMRPFLLGREIIIYTDNCPICHMMEKKIANRRVEKISLLLQEFNIKEIIHVQGRYNCLPDYLSRNPISHDDELIDSEYGLGFEKDQASSSVRLLGAVVTRSKTKAAKPDVRSSTKVDEPLTRSPDLDSSSSLSHRYSTLGSVDHEDFDITRLKERQATDPEIQRVVQALQSNADLSFEFHDGVLYKLFSSPRAHRRRKLIYIPSSMVKSVMTSFHDNPVAGGHFGVKRTIHKIQQQFWWPSMEQSIVDHVQRCLVCQAFNVDRKKRPGFLNPIPAPDGPNLLLGIDYCGPFPTTPDGNRYVLCLTDYFTKFVNAIALPVCTASATAEAVFKEHVCRYGVPKAIISDQGTSFNNQLMLSMSKLLGYHHIFCTAYHPQSNGQTERFNCTFVVQLAKLTDREVNNWDHYLRSIVFAYNTGLHSTTHFSPFELTYGRPANLPISQPPTSFTFSQPNDYFQDLLRSLDYYHTAVKQNISRHQQQSKMRYDHHRSDPHHALGTTVLTRVFINKSKLDPSFSIHPKVIVKHNHPTYWVEDVSTGRMSRVHVNDLRPLTKN